MADLNSYDFTGRLGADVELRSTANGQPVANLRVAVGKRPRDGEDDTLWLDVTVWGKTAETAARFLSKGRQVAVHGRVEGIRTFERRNGETGASLEVTALELNFIGSREDGGRPAPKSDVPDVGWDGGGQSSGSSDADDDIPF